MKFLRSIIKKINNDSQKLNNIDGMTWMEYRHQWLLENDTWTCKKNTIN